MLFWIRPYTPMRGALSNVWFDRYKISRDCPEHLESIDMMCSSLGALIQEEGKAGVPPHRIIVGRASLSLLTASGVRPFACLSARPGSAQTAAHPPTVRSWYEIQKRFIQKHSGAGVRDTSCPSCSRDTWRRLCCRLAYVRERRPDGAASLCPWSSGGSRAGFFWNVSFSCISRIELGIFLDTLESQSFKSCFLLHADGSVWCIIYYFVGSLCSHS